MKVIRNNREIKKRKKCPACESSRYRYNSTALCFVDDTYAKCERCGYELKVMPFQEVEA